MSILNTDTHQRTLTITLNRPAERNALNAELIDAMQETLMQYQDNQAIRAILLQGAGDHFCAGADIKHMQTLQHATPADNIADARKLAELLWTIHTFPKPVIALSQGAAIGGGAGLLAASDIVFATPASLFCFSEVKLGLVPAIISPYIFNTMGSRAMQRYFLTGERFNATSAQQFGLVHDIVAQETLLESGYQLADMLAKNGPTAMQLAKKLIHDVSNQPLNHASALHMAETLATIRQTPEAQEGFRAFIEKRSPNWS